MRSGGNKLRTDGKLCNEYENGWKTVEKSWKSVESGGIEV